VLTELAEPSDTLLEWARQKSRAGVRGGGGVRKAPGEKRHERAGRPVMELTRGEGEGGTRALKNTRKATLCIRSLQLRREDLLRGFAAPQRSLVRAKGGNQLPQQSRRALWGALGSSRRKLSFSGRLLRSRRKKKKGMYFDYMPGLQKRSFGEGGGPAALRKGGGRARRVLARALRAISASAGKKGNY